MNVRLTEEFVDKRKYGRILYFRW